MRQMVVEDDVEEDDAGLILSDSEDSVIIIEDSPQRQQRMAAPPTSPATKIKNGQVVLEDEEEENTEMSEDGEVWVDPVEETEATDDRAPSQLPSTRKKSHSSASATSSAGPSADSLDRHSFPRINDNTIPHPTPPFVFDGLNFLPIRDPLGPNILAEGGEIRRSDIESKTRLKRLIKEQREMPGMAWDLEYQLKMLSSDRMEEGLNQVSLCIARNCMVNDGCAVRFIIV